MKRIGMLCLLAVLAGCASQEFERTEKFDPKGKVVEKTCKAEASSWLRLTQAESLDGAISCTDERDTTFGAKNLIAKGDTESINAVGGIAEKVTAAAVKAGVEAAKPGP